MNRRFAALLLVAAWLTITGAIESGAALASPSPTRCTTYYEATLHRWHTVCSDGTRGISTYNQTLQRWDTTITPPAGKAGSGRPSWPQPGAPRGR